MKERMTPNQHGLYEMGYTRVTLVFTKRCNFVRMSKSRNDTIDELLAETREHEEGIASNRK